MRQWNQRESIALDESPESANGKGIEMECVKEKVVERKMRERDRDNIKECLREIRQ